MRFFVNKNIENVENPFIQPVWAGSCKHFEHSFEHFFRKVDYTVCIFFELSFLPISCFDLFF